MCKQIFFCFSAALGTLHADLHMYYCWQHHTFAIKALLYDAHYFYTADRNIQPNNTYRMHFCVSTATMATLHTYCLSLYLILNTLYCNLQTLTSVHCFYGMVLYTVFRAQVLSHCVSCCESYFQISVLTHPVIFLLHSPNHINLKNGFKLQKFIHSSSLYVMVQ